jgi:stalled ribosome alternative rescue factor ArfA
MPTNLLKKYPELPEIGHLSEHKRRESLGGIFDRDIRNNSSFVFRGKQIRPIKKDGEIPMDTLFRHLTTREEKDEKGKGTGKRSFEMARSQRLHWVRFHVDGLKKVGLDVFSYEDRIDGKDVVRTYLFDEKEAYVIILEPYRIGTDYYLLTAYPLNEPGGLKQIKKKQKGKLPDIH